MPEIYSDIIVTEVTLLLRYMDIKNLDYDKLQLSVRNYMAYKNKTKEEANKKILQKKFKTFLESRFTENASDEEDNKLKILHQIIAKL